MKSPHAEREEKVLEFWKERGIFEKTLKKESPKGEFVFFEGPPTANGKPGIHHIEARVFKDAIPRYKTMLGFHVPRRAGWDTHGLPVEIQVEKELGLKSKKEVEEYGVEAFNKKCKESVFVHIEEFKKLTERIAYWTDFDNAYFTFDNNYIESLWSIVSHVDSRKLLYKDYKVVPWCARCGTGLSSHELAQGYQDVKDLSVYVKFKVVGEENTFILAWTTTPWTLPGNVALAVGKDIDYVKVRTGSDILILAETKLVLMPENFEVIESMKGSDLVGIEYEPLYPFLSDSLPEGEKEKLSKAFKVYDADFVTTEDGTGVVHTAVMYGTDDFVLGTKVGLPKYHLVEPDGHFKKECGFLAGRFVKDEETAVEVIKDLAHRGILFKKEKYEHSYPHCWRCKTPLIYYARDSWYIAMSSLRNDLVSENEKINWEPEYIKEGRFGDWLREVKDWAISRERYWGTPLPVWISEDQSEKLVVDSLETLKAHTNKSGNKYVALRHAQAEHNLSNTASSKASDPIHLTDQGKDEAKIAAEEISTKKITTIYCSPFHRTRETAAIVAEKIGFPLDKIIYDDRLVDIDAGDYNGKEFSFVDFFKNLGSFDEKISNGESPLDVRKRFGSFLYDIDSKHKNENILIVTHGVFFEIADGAINGTKIEEALGHLKSRVGRMPTGGWEEYSLTKLPHNENFELDLHKPYIDEVELVSEKGTALRRTKEVMDVWFDSGAMPFAQDHYPFENKEVAYPADFISEAIDQTRGWFYTLHAVGALMGRGHAYKNVICLGHLLDKNGKKMSKSLGNVIDPWEQMEKWGADAIGLWMYSVNQPGESKNYDEKTVDEVNKKVFNLVGNVFSFYELYRDRTLEWNTVPESSHALDKWILLRLDNLVKEMTLSLDAYKLLEPVRALRAFIDDLSTWYLQLSRDRFRNDDAGGKQTLYYVLKTLSKLFAPFAPFFAEDLYQKLRGENDCESVHLEKWPEAHSATFLEKIFGGNKDSKLLSDMEKTRQIVSLGLDARMKANIKVRQPLSLLTVKKSLEVEGELQNLVTDRVNVKAVAFKDLEEDAVLDTEITNDLKEEGVIRELIRFVQDMRKKQGLTPSDRISLSISANEAGKIILSKSEWQIMLKETVLAENIDLKDGEGENLVVEDLEFVVSVVRA
ncbi:MAG: class I tRNA ligase family protein [Candidatus Paceibacterota bacterium]|jgi:isoleucyl-tRNA synthetase